MPDSPDSVDDAAKKKTGKLRRNREFAADGAIQSKLPSADSPQSRVHKGDDTAGRGLYVDARNATEPLSREQLVNQVVCGDSAEVLAMLPEASVACAVTSPPYWHMVDYGYEGQIGADDYQTYRDNLAAVWKGVARALRPNGKFVLNVPLMPLRKDVSAKWFGKTHTRMFIDLYADLRADILEHTELIQYSLYIWEKQTTEKMFGSYPYPPNLLERNYIEFLAVFVKPGAPPKMAPEVKEKAKLTQDEWMELTKQIWWMYPKNVGRAKGHPAPFPESLPNRFINMYTFPEVEGVYEGDLVLDPFAGWGTTCAAAKRLGRRYIGIDLSTEFCDRATEEIAATPVQRVIMEATRPSERDQGSLF